MALCPFAKLELIPPGSSDPPITPRVAVWHVAVSMAVSLFLFFRDRSGGIESHFYINWRGVLYQYRDTAYQADANYRANDFAVSIETAGMGLGRWNLLQRRTMRRFAAWLYEVDGIPLAVCGGPYGSGHGYHTQWGSPSDWTPVAKSCPGPERIRQFHEWFVPWLRTERVRQMRKTRPARLRIRQANLWRENKHIAEDLVTLVKGRPHVVGTNESANWMPELRQVPGYRLLAAAPHAARWWKQNTVLLRDDVEYLSHGVRMMCHAVGTSPARTAVYVCYSFGGQNRAHISTHANAHVEKGQQARTLPRVREFIEHMVNLVKLVRELEGKGYRVTLSGDLNWAWVRRAVAFTHAPKRVLGRVGLRAQWSHKTAPSWNRRRIDYIAYDPDDLQPVEQRLVAGEHSDHPWPEVTFEIQE